MRFRRLGFAFALAFAAVALLAPSEAFAFTGGTFSGAGPTRLGPIEVSTGTLVVEWYVEPDVSVQFDWGYVICSAGAEDSLGASVLSSSSPRTIYIDVTGAGYWELSVLQPRPLDAPIGGWFAGDAGSWVSEPFFLPPGVNTADWIAEPEHSRAVLHPVSAEGQYHKGISPESPSIVSRGEVYVLEMQASEPWELEFVTPTPPPTNVYRFFNRRNGAHFYTASAQERDTILARWSNVFTYEGVAYTVNGLNSANSYPILRFYNPHTGAHFYTTSPDEKYRVLSVYQGIYWYEGPTYSVSISAGTPVHRFYNRRTGTHFYTASADECAMVQRRWPNIFTYEGAGFYIAP